PPTRLFRAPPASEQAALAAVSVLLGRERTGIGDYVEVAIADAARRLAAPRDAGLTTTGGHLAGAFPGYNLYRTTDGWVAVPALEPHFYRRLCERFGVSIPPYESFAACFASQDNSYWTEFAARHDLPIEPVNMTS